MGVILSSDAPTEMGKRISDIFGKEMADGDEDFCMAMLAIGLSMLYQILENSPARFADVVGYMANAVIKKDNP